MRGFQLLTTNSPEKKVDFSKYESILGLEIPPLFKLFYQTFDVGADFKVPSYYHKEYEGKYYAGSTSFEQFKEWPISIHKFDNLDEIFQNWETKKLESDWERYNFLRVSGIDIGGGLYVGMNDNDRDKVFLIVWDWEEEYIEIAGNLFEFVRGLKFKEDENCLYGYKYSQLYKSWGDSLWNAK